MIKNILTFGFLSTIFSILLALGFWQTQRLEWKTNIIKKLDDIYAQEASNNIYQYDDLVIDDQKLPILYGSVTGRFIYDKEVLLGPRPFDGAVGYNIITPLKMSDGTILVNRGFIAVDQKELLETTRNTGRVFVSGLFRTPDWNKFTPNNNPEKNVWSKLDIQEIARYQGIEEISPLMLYAEEVEPTQDILKLQESRWMPRNKHMQYAIFWFGMAFLLPVLVLVFLKSKK